MKPAEVARRLKVSRTSVWRWGRALEANGRRALRHPPQLSEAKTKQLLTALEAGALAHGYSAGPWTLAREAKLIILHDPRTVIRGVVIARMIRGKHG